MHATRCTDLSIEGCRFVSRPLRPPAAGWCPSARSQAGEELFAAAILGSQALSGLRVTRCTFTVGEPFEHARQDPPERARGAGLRQATATMWPHSGFAQGPADAVRMAALPLLDDAVFDGNLFERLTAPAVAIGQLGTLRIERNSVRDCHAGFWLVIQDASHVLTFLDRLVNQAGDAYRDLVSAHLTALAEPLLFHTTVLARTLPRRVA